MPSVSPHATSSETPASAVILPKVFTTFSARIASLAPFIRLPSPGPTTAQPREMNVGDHCDQDGGTDHDIEGEGVNALQGEAVLQHTEHDAADEPADDRASAASDRGAADDARGDAEECCCRRPKGRSSRREMLRAVRSARPRCWSARNCRF